MKNHENRIDFESISVAGGQIELALVIYLPLRQFYAQQIFQVHCTLAQLPTVPHIHTQTQPSLYKEKCHLDKQVFLSEGLNQKTRRVGSNSFLTH